MASLLSEPLFITDSRFLIRIKDSIPNLYYVRDKDVSSEDIANSIKENIPNKFIDVLHKNINNDYYGFMKAISHFSKNPIKSFCDEYMSLYLSKSYIYELLSSIPSGTSASLLIYNISRLLFFYKTITKGENPYLDYSIEIIRLGNEIDMDVFNNIKHTSFSNMDVNDIKPIYDNDGVINKNNDCLKELIINTLPIIHDIKKDKEVVKGSKIGDWVISNMIYISSVINELHKILI